MNKFNKVYNKIKNNISIIVEDFNNNSLLTSGTFDFKTDPDNNIICTFSMNNNGNKIIVVAKFINNELTFNITENNGQTRPTEQPYRSQATRGEAILLA